MAHVDYDFYKDKYRGRAIPASDFEVLSMRAGAYINQLKCAYSVTEICRDGFGYACCACADVIWAIARMGGIKSQSVGGVSFTRETPRPVDQELWDTARMYLHVYRGAKR